jgi:hypothetical protein
MEKRETLLGKIMSKRYGRNQKRKAKAQIEKMQKEIASFNYTTATAKRIVGIAYQINPNAICFEPERIGDHYLTHERTSLNSVLVGGGNEPARMININYIDLYQLEAVLIESEFDRMLHFDARVYNPHKNGLRAGYRVSREGFVHLSIDEVAKELARHLKSVWR